VPEEPGSFNARNTCQERGGRSGPRNLVVAADPGRLEPRPVVSGRRRRPKNARQVLYRPIFRPLRGAPAPLYTHNYAHFGTSGMAGQSRRVQAERRSGSGKPVFPRFLSDTELVVGEMRAISLGNPTCLPANGSGCPQKSSPHLCC